MSKYIVGVKEVYEVQIKVEAESLEEAIEKARAIVNDENDFVILERDTAMEYSHHLPEEDWNVYKLTNEENNWYELVDRRKDS